MGCCRFKIKGVNYIYEYYYCGHISHPCAYIEGMRLYRSALLSRADCIARRYKVLVEVMFDDVIVSIFQGVGLIMTYCSTLNGPETAVYRDFAM